jgi:hypothetical protein
MTHKFRKALLTAAALLISVVADAHVIPTPPPAPPNPQLFMIGTESYETGGKQFVRYRYDVANKDAYPAAMFAAAPRLPPCGTNTKASRTWVDVYDQRGKRLNGFCAFGNPNDLGQIWFALEEGVNPPSYVFIVLTDRQTKAKYKSNLAETTL